MVKTKTYKMDCKTCGSSYRTGVEQGKKVALKIKENPNYLGQYQCRKCGKGNSIKPFPETRTTRKIVQPTQPLPQVDIDVRQYIPKRTEMYVNRKLGDTRDDKLLMFHLTHTSRLMKNVLFIGDTGTGKTICVENFCFKNKLPYHRVVMNAGTTTEDIVGQMIMNKDGKFSFNYQVLIRFMRKGGVFVFDEINAGQKEILHILNSITDSARAIAVTQNKGEVIEAIDKFLVVACMNPPDEYDLQPMSISLKSRFTPYYFVYDSKIDQKVLGKGEEKLVELAKAIRLAKVNGQISTPLSTRDLVQYKLVREGLGYKTAKEMLVHKFNNGEKNVVRTMIETHLEKSKILDKASENLEGE